MTSIINILVVKVRRIINYFILFLCKISKMLLNRSGETSVELATQGQKSFVFLHNLKRLKQFYVLTGRSSTLLQIHNQNNTINSKIT